MDNELKQLAALQLRNAFWYEFSALVNKYIDASEGLDIEEQEMLISEKTSVYGRNFEIKSNSIIDIQTSDNAGNKINHKNIVDALNDTNAKEVYLLWKKIFERINGEWYLCEQ